jgi:RES domain-containing protein
MLLFRVTPERERTKAFDGMGAARYPGRWNNRDEPTVYLAARLSLAILEILVQDSVTGLEGYGFFTLELHDEIVLASLDLSHLPPLWRTSDPGREQCRTIASATSWRSRSSGLIVPSAVIPEGRAHNEFNVVIDPTRMDLRQAPISPWQELVIDERLAALAQTRPLAP